MNKGVGSGVGSGSGSISQRYGSGDPDPDPTKTSQIPNTGRQYDVGFVKLIYSSPNVTNFQECLM
jgi:hypothetical protein